MSTKPYNNYWEVTKGKIAKFCARIMPQAIAYQIVETNKGNTNFQQISYAQEGEDLLLFNLMNTNNGGFFVDIGAHHPLRLSNTQKLYAMGWNGINIDPTPGGMQVFKKLRSRDINLELGISNVNEKLTFYQFNEPALNTFDKEKALKVSSESNFNIVKQIEIETVTLESVLDQYLTLKQNIDFLNIDVEGFELNVLKSNNWNKYKPKMLLVENIKSTLQDVMDSEVTTYLAQIGYKPVAKGLRSVFYKLSI